MQCTPASDNSVTESVDSAPIIIPSPSLCKIDKRKSPVPPIVYRHSPVDPRHLCLASCRITALLDHFRRSCNQRPCVNDPCLPPRSQTYSEAHSKHDRRGNPSSGCVPRCLQKRIACRSKGHVLREHVFFFFVCRDVNFVRSASSALRETATYALPPCRVVKHFQNICCTDCTVRSTPTVGRSRPELLEWTWRSAERICELPVVVWRW
jgi:hypothetical protein